MANRPSSGDKVDRLFAGLTGPLAEVARTLRTTVRRAAPALVETVKWGSPSYLGRGNVAYIAVYDSHVNLGFYHGAELAERGRNLEGTGKGLRHVKVRSIAEARTPALASLVREAAELDARE